MAVALNSTFEQETVLKNHISRDLTKKVIDCSNYRKIL